MITGLKNSFLYSLNGFKVTWKEERNFRIEVLIAIALVFFLYYFDFTYIEWLFCIFAMAGVLGGEIINTIVEDICNKIEPNTDPVIKKIKDMAAAFVLLLSISSLLVGAIVVYTHFV